MMITTYDEINLRNGYTTEHSISVVTNNELITVLTYLRAILMCLAL